MNKIVLSALILVLFSVWVNAQEANITWNRAASLAQNKYPELVTTPQSMPPHPVDTGIGKYWVVEFDNVWVPVAYSDGKILTIEEPIIKTVYRAHWVIQQVSMQRQDDKYPTKQKLALIGLENDVKRHENFLDTNKGKLPSELEGEAGELLSRTRNLKTAIEGTKSQIERVETVEAGLISSSSSLQDVGEWQSEFALLLDQMELITANGDVYDAEEVNFNKESTSFMETSNDSQMKKTVEEFLDGLGMFSTSSLTGLNSTASTWKTTFLGVQLSNKTVTESVDNLYSYHSEMQTESSVVELRQKAADRLDPLTKTVPGLTAKLYPCRQDLTSSQKKNLDALNSSYSEAMKHWEDGNDAYDSLDFKTAKDHYLNAEAYGREAEERYNSLEGVDCKEEPPPQRTIWEILEDFIHSPMGWVAIILVLVLIFLYFWNRRKEGEYDDYEDYPASLPEY